MRRDDPTEEYDRIPVAVAAVRAPAAAAGRGLRQSVGGDRRRPGRRSPAGSRPRSAAAGPRAPMPASSRPSTPELHAYVVEHGARQDELLRRLAAETAASSATIAIMQIAPDQGALHDPARARDRRPAGARARHLHRLLGDLHRPRAARRRAARHLRRQRGVGRDRAPLLRGGRASPTGSTCGSARRSRRCARCPRDEPFDFAFIDADKAELPRLLRGVPAPAAPRRPGDARQRASRRPRASTRTDDEARQRWHPRAQRAGRSPTSASTWRCSASPTGSPWS